MPAKKKIYKLPTYLDPREKNNKHKYKYIPKKIFQTGETNEVTKGMYDAVYTWIDKNPDWEYHFFDKAARRDFITKHFPKKVLDAYDNLIPGAYKADLWRYCVLYIHGGLYVDNKSEFLANSLNDVIPEDVEFLSLQEMDSLDNNGCGVKNLRIMQSFIVTKRKHPFFKKAIDLVVENVETGYYGYTPVCPTGPRLLGMAIQKVLKTKEVNPNWIGKNNISGFEFILWADRNVYKYPNNDGWLIGIDQNFQPVYRYRYKNYLKEQIMLSGCGKPESFYRYSWLMDKIYTHSKVVRPKPKNTFEKMAFQTDLMRTCDKLYNAGYKKEIFKVILHAIKNNNFYYISCVKLLFSFVLRKLYK